MVPNGWNSKPLVQLLDKIIDYRGQSVPKSSFGIPLITARNVREGYLDFSNQEYIDESKFKEWMTRGAPQKGDILFTTEAPLGKACRYPNTGVYGVGQRTVTLRTNDKLDSEFLLYTILSERGQRLIDVRSSGSTAKGIKSSELKKIKITYPEPLPEQRKIAKILSTWDKAISTTERLINNSKQQKKALMQQLLTGKKRLLDDSGKPFEGEWEDLHLADIASIKKGKALSAKNVISGTYPVIAGGKTSPYSHNEYTHENIVTVSASGAYAGYVSHHEYKIWASDCSVVTEKKDNCLLFIFQFLKLNQNKIYSMQSGGAQPHIYPKDLQVLKVKKPNLDEQLKIASVLTNADQEIELLEQQLADLKQEKKALMQQLLTGKRRVIVDEKEVA